MNNLRIGSSGQSVLELQQYLKSRGLYSGALDGKFGPKTDSAVKQFQQSQGIKVDGIVGPITRSKMGGGSSSQQNPNININHPGVQAAINKDPRMADIANRLYQSGDMSIDALIASMTSGNYSGLPWDEKTVKKELNKQMGVLSPYFEEDQAKGTLDLKGTLGQAQRDFENYLTTSGEEFKANKDTQDVEAADQGVLFSSGRVQKLNNLKSAYERDQDYKRSSLSSNIGQATRDYQYKYGSGAANSLSDYFKLGGNTYDAMTPRGVVGSMGLSSVYNPSSTNFYGTNRTLQRSQAIQRAAAVLAAKGNKLMPYGYQNQF